ncbi:hypothetical protein L9F63_002238 [Diploptera punctata]|uniref:Thioredoxin domain-containing protein n=1 Tax=Diploptera punctata TaxID=6984 RepID=A0AAD8A2H8_DIPPU|nr:hypothetical protein L9F63_002238 [Diploptera punctata]
MDLGVYEVFDGDDFQNKISEAGSSLIVVVFYGCFAHSYKNIKSEVDKLPEEFPGVVFLKIDVELLEDLSDDYEIRLPTFTFVKDRKKIDVYEGRDIIAIKNLITKYK